MELKVSKQDAIAFYKTAPDMLKKSIEDLFGGKGNLKFSSWKDINSFEDVCEIAGENPDDFDIPEDATTRERGTILYNKLQLICEVYREGVVLDYADRSQTKYYLWGEYKSGSGFSLNVVGNVSASTNVGARLSVDTREKALLIWELFSDTYNAYWLGK